MSGQRRADEGMILVNVLLIVALAASVVALMMSTQELAIARSVRLREAAQAAAIARGGELSAMVALRDATSADADRSALSAVAQHGVAIEGGTFELSVADAQSRWNLATVHLTDPDAAAALRRVGRLAGVSDADLTRIVLAANGSGSLPEVSASEAARLAGVATLLPVPSRVNLASADPQLVTALVGNSQLAQALIRQRASLGSIAGGLPPAFTMRSDLFWTRARVTIGDTAQELTSLLLRRYRDGRPQVVAIGRWWGPTSPLVGPDVSDDRSEPAWRSR